jgi:F-type H+-transporting ATPase subunit delta
VVSESTRQIVREVYSEVLFELAEQADCVDSVWDDLECVRKVLRAEPQFMEILTSPRTSGTDRAQIVRRVFEGKVENLTLDFLSVLARRGRMGFIEPISDRYEMLVDTHRGRVLVEVTVAKVLDNEQSVALRDDLTDAIKREVKLSVNVDPAIIGGIIIKKNDTVIDNSVKTALKRAVANITGNLEDRI